MGAFFAALKETIVSQFAGFGILTVLDLLIVAYIIYVVIKLLTETRALSLIKGVVMLLVVLELSGIIGLETTNYVLKSSLQVGLIAIIIVFQPELRHALEQFGRSRFGLEFVSAAQSGGDLSAAAAIDAVCEACELMSRRRVGALLVFEREIKLVDIVQTGTVIDAKVNAAMIVSLFFPNSPMHDGAVIIRDGRLLAAGCFLPLTQNNDLSKELGTRHRAALGMSETSDAFVLIISEETGTISSAEGGSIVRGYQISDLKKELTARFVKPKESNPFDRLFRREGARR